MSGDPLKIWSQQAKPASSAIVVVGLLTAVVIMKLRSLKLGYRHRDGSDFSQALKHVVFQSLSLTKCLDVI